MRSFNASYLNYVNIIAKVRGLAEPVSSIVS